MFDGDIQFDRPTARRTDPVTSHDAARLAEATANKHRELAYRLLCEHPEGLTDFDLADLSGLQQTSIGKRRGELRDRGFVKKTDRKRRTPSGAMAIVWVAVERPMLTENLFIAKAKQQSKARSEVHAV